MFHGGDGCSRGMGVTGGMSVPGGWEFQGDECSRGISVPGGRVFWGMGNPIKLDAIPLRTLLHTI